MEGQGPRFQWDALIPHVVHPLQVAILEAMIRIDRPLSAVELEQIFDKRFALSLISYHVNRLASFGVIAAVRRQPVRGAMQTFYFFT